MKLAVSAATAGLAVAAFTVPSAMADAGTEAPTVVQTATITAATTAPTTATTTAVRTVRYGSHVRQTMDIYTPARAVGKVGQYLGTVVLIHGGAWIKGDKADLAPEARQLARRGYVVANINYRYATDAAWPAPRTDSINAVKFLRSHARSLNVDNHRIVLIGSSAGAQLATSVATWGRGKDLVSGVVALSGPLGMRRTAFDPAGHLNTVVRNVLLRCTPAQCGSRYDGATPKNHLTRGDVPSLLFSSRHEWLNPQNSIDFVQKARRVGLSSRLVWIPGTLHARYYWDQAWPTIRDWVAQRMAR